LGRHATLGEQGKRRGDDDTSGNELFHGHARPVGRWNRGRDILNALEIEKGGFRAAPAVAACGKHHYE
jgi:hypothetical protein